MSGLDPDKIMNLKKTFKLPHYRISIPEKNVKELKKKGTTTILLSLRHNYPLQTGIEYAKNKLAMITNKTYKHGKFEYELKKE